MKKIRLLSFYSLSKQTKRNSSFFDSITTGIFIGVAMKLTQIKQWHTPAFLLFGFWTFGFLTFYDLISARSFYSKHSVLIFFPRRFLLLRLLKPHKFLFEFFSGCCCCLSNLLILLFYFHSFSFPFVIRWR